jgi:hypothetical protein
MHQIMNPRLKLFLLLENTLTTIIYFITFIFLYDSQQITNNYLVKDH